MLRALLVLLLAIAQIIVPQASRIVGFGTPIGDVGGSVPRGPEEPSGYAFAIWGLIFALALLFAVRQVMPSRRDAALYQAVGGAAVVVFGTSCAWMLEAQFRGHQLVLLGSIWVMLLAAARGFYRALAMRPTLDAFDRFVTLPMFALYTGWLAAAVWLSTAAVAKPMITSPLLTPTLVAVLVVMCIAAASLLLLRRAHGYLPLGLTTLWALGGIAHANLTARPNTQIAALAIGLAVLLIAYLLWQRRPVARREF